MNLKFLFLFIDLSAVCRWRGKFWNSNISEISSCNVSLTVVSLVAMVTQRAVVASWKSWTFINSECSHPLSLSLPLTLAAWLLFSVYIENNEVALAVWKHLFIHSHTHTYMNAHRNFLPFCTFFLVLEIKKLTWPDPPNYLNSEYLSYEHHAFHFNMQRNLKFDRLSSYGCEAMIGQSRRRRGLVND